MASMDLNRRQADAAPFGLASPLSGASCSQAKSALGRQSRHACHMATMGGIRRPHPTVPSGKIFRNRGTRNAPKRKVFAMSLMAWLDYSERERQKMLKV